MDQGHGGGSSRLSGGIVYAGGGTKYQKAAGYEDTPENMFNYLKLECEGAVDDETIRKFCNDSIDNLDWLEKCGARFSESLSPHKLGYPAERHYLYYSGNEEAYPYNQAAWPVPRGHRTLAPHLASGATLWAALTQRAKELGVEMLPLARANQVVVEDGRVKGLRYRVMPKTARGFKMHQRLNSVGAKLLNWVPPIGKAMANHADKLWDRTAEPHIVETNAIVLSAGGFVFNQDMVRQYNKKAEGTSPLGNKGDDGSGIRLGVEVGGRVSHMDSVAMWRFLSPPEAFLRGIAVGPDGQRIINEDLYGVHFTEAMANKTGGKGFLIVDSATFNLAKKTFKDELHRITTAQAYYTLFWGYRKASSLDLLAQKLGISAEGLRTTVAAYNTGIRGGTGDPFHKATKYSVPISQGPFYGIDVSIRPSLLHAVPAITMGGLKVEGKTGLVLSEAGDPIPGLYAAGRNAVGFPSRNYTASFLVEEQGNMQLPGAIQSKDPVEVM
ncbi:hypothetical protein LTS17_009961 [Exophiala oligosperma]